MGISGEQFVSTMSYEMGNWIKDTSILWIKNKGAGNTTTEAEVIKIQEKNKLNNEIKKILADNQSMMDAQNRAFIEKAKKLG